MCVNTYMCVSILSLLRAIKSTTFLLFYYMMMLIMTKSFSFIFLKNWVKFREKNWFFWKFSPLACKQIFHFYFCVWFVILFGIFLLTDFFILFLRALRKCKWIKCSMYERMARGAWRWSECANKLSSNKHSRKKHKT